MTFQIHALRPEPFEALFAKSDDELRAMGARRVVADSFNGFPCRVSLQDADAGDTLILCNYRHLDVASPYAATHAIYVREGVAQAHPAPGEVPEVMASRLLSVRGFNDEGYMHVADVVDGRDLGATLDAMFADAAVEFVDVHNAKQGCFAGRATREGETA
jgi:hypothetical protein